LFSSKYGKAVFTCFELSWYCSASDSISLSVIEGTLTSSERDRWFESSRPSQILPRHNFSFGLVAFATFRVVFPAPPKGGLKQGMHKQKVVPWVLTFRCQVVLRYLFILKYNVKMKPVAEYICQFLKVLIKRYVISHQKSSKPIHKLQ